MKSRYEIARKWLIFWCLFIGIGAVAGSTGMLLKPDGSALGMQEMLTYFQVLPFADVLFQNFIFSGISLLIVNGLTNLIAAMLMIKKKKAGIIAGGIFGVTLMLWICIQFYMFPLNFMSTIYFIFGLIQALTGLAAYIFYKQEKYAEEEKKKLSEQNSNIKFRKLDTDNSSIDTENRELVVFFSRMGYTRHYAFEIAEKRGADIYEVKSTERTEGTAGFWWCGRFGMHRMDMPIEAVTVDLKSYDKIIICSPIWVFSLCAPMRSFCRAAGNKVAKVQYVLVHFQRAKYMNACREMDKLLGIQREKVISICVRQGKEVKRYEFN